MNVAVININESKIVNISPVVMLTESVTVLLSLMYAFDGKLTVAPHINTPDSFLLNELIMNSVE
jgi:hypothetical protein